MNLNDLLLTENFDPKQVLALRHRPQETELNLRKTKTAA